MPIPGIQQPDILDIGPGLRLRKFDGVFHFAIPWYQDPSLQRLVDGVQKPYPPERVKAMYEYLNACGELYFIEVLEEDTFTPVGDVTFSREDLPMVLGPAPLRGKHIGRRVLTALIDRARALGYDSLTVRDIFDFNTASQSCYQSVGFRPTKQTKLGHSYRLDLSL